MRRYVPTLVIDESPVFRAGLIHILAGTRFRVLAQYTNLNDLPNNAAVNDAEYLALIGLDGDPAAILTQIRCFKTRYGNGRVLILGDHFEPENLLAVIESGADGYVLKNEISADALLKTLDLVVHGEAILPQCFLQLLRNRMHSRIEALPDSMGAKPQEKSPEAQGVVKTTNAGDIRPLSSKEQLVLEHLTRGASNKRIARELDVAEATVKVHMKAILRKIRVSNRTQAAMWATNNLDS